MRIAGDLSDTSIIMWPSAFCGDCSAISQACCVNEDTNKFFSKLCLLSESCCCFQKCDRNSGCRFCPMVHTKLGQIILCLSHTILLQCFVFGWGWQVVENMKAIEILPKLTPDVLKRIDSVVHNKPKQPDQYRWRIELLSLRCFLQDNKWFYFAGKLEGFLLQKNDNFGAIVCNASVVSRHAIQICIFCLL